MHLFVLKAFLTAYLYAFIISAWLFLERAIHAFIHLQLFQQRSYMRIILACVFLERTIHAFIRSQLSFPTASLRFACFYNEPYMHISLSSSTFPTPCLSAFIISTRVFLERAIHACAFFRFQLLQVRFYMRLLFRLAC